MFFANLFGTPSTTSTPPSTSQGKFVFPNIYVLPCLQELKKGGGIGRQLNFELEQQPSTWDDSQKIQKPLFPGILTGILIGSKNASDEFDKYWSGNRYLTGSLKKDDPRVTKNGLLTIPDFSPYGFYSRMRTASCSSFTCSQKWSMYTKFLYSKFDEAPRDNSNIALLVTHHNRMRSSYDNQALIPFKSKEFGAYANNFCLKIVVQKSKRQVDFSIFFSGFPDKGAFKGVCKDKDELDAIIQQNYGQTGGGDYVYMCEPADEPADKPFVIDDFIDTNRIRSGILSGLGELSQTSTDTITIDVIRHGNSFHNDPVSIKDKMMRLDSSLTPFGMFQADLLGKFLATKIPQNSNILLCASFLERTQLTGLSILEAAGIQLPPIMMTGLVSMKERAFIRYIRAAIAIKKKYNLDMQTLKSAPSLKVKEKVKEKLKEKFITARRFLDFYPLTPDRGIIFIKFLQKKMEESASKPDSIIPHIISSIIYELQSSEPIDYETIDYETITSVVSSIVGNVQPDVEGDDDDEYRQTSSCFGPDCFPGGGKTHKKGRKVRKTKKARKTKKVRKQKKNKTRR